MSQQKKDEPSESLLTTIGLATAVGAIWAYNAGVRPWHRHWGATRDELNGTLPGDELVPRPTYSTTRAVTIQTAPEEIWPHLVEIGRRHGRLYTDSQVEASEKRDRGNGRARPRKKIHVDDVVRFGPAPWIGQSDQMQVIELIPYRAIVFGSMRETIARLPAQRSCRGTWAFVLEPVDETSTRLVIRTRARPSWARQPVVSLYDPIHFFVERTLLLDVKEAVEASSRAEEEPIPA
ncbi:hypothetical protein [Longibacter salinarum]|uniref:hypothetical protein n=1 Tax=Longibacter salinarum TaxID=1850348 RepID=UPI0011804709|nr:hypothetical protein [Longibacter salinarum]